MKYFIKNYHIRVLNVCIENPFHHYISIYVNSLNPENKLVESLFLKIVAGKQEQKN